MTRELKVMYMWPFKWPQLIDLFTDTAGNKLCIGKKVYLKHLPRRIRMWNVVSKEKEEPENLEKKKLLEGRRDLTTVTSRVALGPRPHWLDGVRDCPHPLPSLPPPPRRSPLTIIFIPRQWILNLEGSRGRGGGEAINRGTAIIRGNTVNMSSIIIVKCLYNVYIIFFVEY